MGGALEMWVIYDHPRDYPNHFAVRRHVILPGVIGKDPHVYLAPTLKQARKFIPKGYVRVPRCPLDDPVILECWV